MPVLPLSRITTEMSQPDFVYKSFTLKIIEFAKKEKENSEKARYDE